jgi:hypothetical protein
MRNRIFHQVRIAGITFEGLISADGPYISASTAGGVALVVSALRHFQPETVGSRRPQPAGWWVVKYHSEEGVAARFVQNCTLSRLGHERRANIVQWTEV